MCHYIPLTKPAPRSSLTLAGPTRPATCLDRGQRVPSLWLRSLNPTVDMGPADFTQWQSVNSLRGDGAGRRERHVGSGATRNTRRSHGKRFIHRPFTSQRLGSNQAVGPDAITIGLFPRLTSFRLGLLLPLLRLPLRRPQVRFRLDSSVRSTAWSLIFLALDAMDDVYLLLYLNYYSWPS